MIRNLWLHRRPILRNAAAEVRYRYTGSVLGVFWNLVNPVVQIALYYVVFSKLFYLRVPGLLEPRLALPLYLCAGVLSWLAFTETVARCTNSFVVNARYLRFLSVPEQVFVAQEAAAATCGLLLSMGLLAVATLLSRGHLGWAWLELPVILLLFQAFAFGLGLTLGVLNVFIRDVGQMIHLLLLVWFWATPIAYVQSALPEGLQAWLGWNPAWAYIGPIQRIVVAGHWASPRDLAACCLAAFVSCAVGYLVLRALRSQIRDVL